MGLNKILICDDQIVILNTLEAILQDNINAEISTESHSPNVIRRLLNESINFLIVSFDANVDWTTIDQKYSRSQPTSKYRYSMYVC